MSGIRADVRSMSQLESLSRSATRPQQINLFKNNGLLFGIEASSDATNKTNGRFSFEWENNELTDKSSGDVRHFPLKGL